MLKNRQEQLEKKQPSNDDLGLAKMQSIQDIPWIDRYMELAIAFDAADINNKGNKQRLKSCH